MSKKLPVINFQNKVCGTCGACCAYYSREFISCVPVNLTVEDSKLSAYVEPIDRKNFSMVLEGDNYAMIRKNDRCVGFEGEVDESCSCKINDIKPRNCREFEVGGSACNNARNYYELPFIDHKGNIRV